MSSIFQPDGTPCGRFPWAVPLLISTLSIARGDTIATARTEGGKVGDAVESTVTIGLLTPVSDSGHPEGIAGTRGAQLALEEANVLAGFFQKRFELVIEEIEKSRDVVPAARRLVEEARAVAIISGLGSAQMHLLARVCERAEIPLLNNAGRDRRLRSRTWRYCYHVEVSHRAYVSALGEHFVAEQGLRRWFLVRGVNAAEKEAARDARSFLSENRGTIVGTGVVRSGERGLGSLLARIRQSQPEVLFLSLEGPPQRRFLDAYALTGGSASIASVFLDIHEMWNEPYPGHVASVFWPGLWYHELFRYSARELNSRYRKRFGVPMESSAWTHWAAVKLVAEAVIRTGKSDGPTLRAYFEGQPPFDGHKGSALTLEAGSGQLRQTIYVLGLKAGGQETHIDLFDVVDSSTTPAF